MAQIIGTEGPDSILQGSLSLGVTSNPPVTGTSDEFSNTIFGRGGADRIETGDGLGEVHGGDGNDEIHGGAAADTLYGDAGSDLLTSGDLRYGDFEVLDGGAGADRMIGGQGQQFFIVDDYGDTVFDGGTVDDPDFDGDAYDTIFTNLNYTLSESAGIENLSLGDEYFGVAARPWTIFGTGNSSANFITGNDYHNVLDGKDGADQILGGGGFDLVLGGRGDDNVSGQDGCDVVRGQDGLDIVGGGAGTDVLVGGRGADAFFWNFTEELTARATDVVCAGDGAVAFEGAGAAAGDTILLPSLVGFDAASGTLIPLAFDQYVFGGTEMGHINLTNAGSDTVVRVNLDQDREFEFQIRIEDGAVRASAYTADDFVSPF